MTDDVFVVPRCEHGNIILGCPHKDCVEQNAYLAKSRQAVAAYEANQQAEARKLVRSILGLPPEER